MKNALLSIERVRGFFAVNGMDTLEGCRIEVAETFAGQEFCTREEAYRALGYFQALYKDLFSYCNINQSDDQRYVTIKRRILNSIDALMMTSTECSLFYTEDLRSITVGGMKAQPNQTTRELIHEDIMTEEELLFMLKWEDVQKNN